MAGPARAATSRLSWAFALGGETGVMSRPGQLWPTSGRSSPTRRLRPSFGRSSSCPRPGLASVPSNPCDGSWARVMGVDLIAVGALIAILGAGGALLFQIQIMLYKANDRVLGFHPGERLRATIRGGWRSSPLATRTHSSAGSPAMTTKALWKAEINEKPLAPSCPGCNSSSSDRRHPGELITSALRVDAVTPAGALLVTLNNEGVPGRGSSLTRRL